MYNLADYETRMVHDGKRNNREVKIICDRCKTEKWVRWERVKKGLGRFCSLECFNEYQKETDVLATIGKENAKKAFDKKTKRWSVYWHDKDRTRHTTSYARWWWEINKGEIPSGYRTSYKDGNSENIDPENIILISKEEYGSAVSKRLMGHRFSEETLKKMSDRKKGRHLSESHKANMSIALKQRWASGNFNRIHVGKYHRNWRGGVSNGYPRTFNKELKDFIKQRDKYICRVCSSDVRLAVHHIDADKMNNEHDNLITLCKSCHLKVHDTSPREKDPIILAFRSKLKVLSNFNAPK